MDKEFIPYEQALDLKELGFNRRTFATYSTTQNNKWILTPDLSGEGTFSGSGEGQYPKSSSACIAPTFSQAFRFFRENFSLDVTFRKMDYGLESNFTGYYFSIYRGNELIDIHGADKKCKLYEESEFECLKKLIEIVKQK